jgi:DNA-binding protein YbaB
MFDKIKDFNRMRKIQAEMKKELEQIFATTEKGNIRIVIRGDKKIEKLTVDGEESKQLKDAINDTMKEVDKKVEKQMRGKMADFGLPGF